MQCQSGAADDKLRTFRNHGGNAMPQVGGLAEPAAVAVQRCKVAGS